MLGALSDACFSLAGRCQLTGVCSPLLRARKRSSRAVRRACRTACVWDTSRQSDTEHLTLNSGRTDTLFRTWSSTLSQTRYVCYFLVPVVHKLHSSCMSGLIFSCVDLLYCFKLSDIPHDKNSILYFF